MARNITQTEYEKRATQLLQKLQEDLSPFDDPSEQAKIRRKKRAEKDLMYFCTTYFPHHFDQPFESGHREMANSVKTKNKIIQWEAFRGAGKTTLAFIGYAMHQMLFRKVHYVPVISDNDDMAELLILPMKVELESNPRILEDFGDQKGITWSQDVLITRTNIKIEANSWRSFKRGRKHMQWRPGLIIGDDWESKETARNPENSRKREDTLMGDIFNALDLKKPWQILMVTNKLGRKCLNTLLEENDAVTTVKVPARRGSRLDGDPTHPETFPEKVLGVILDNIGIVRFSLEYLLKVVSGEHDDFQEQWLARIKKPSEKRMFRVTAVDPSVGSTTGHDAKAIITMDISMDLQQFDIVDAWIRHDTIREMCKAMFKINTTLNPDEVVIESNGFQQLIRDKLINLAHEPREKDLLTKIYQLKNSVNKNVRIMRLQTPIQNKTIRFVDDAGDIETLINQLLEFKSDRTDNTDDGPDATEMAYRRLKEKAGLSTNEVNAEVIE